MQRENVESITTGAIAEDQRYGILPRQVAGTGTHLFVEGLERFGD